MTGIDKIKETLFVSTNLTGKMEGMVAISSACSNNPNCEKLSQIEGSICSKCYARTGLSYRKNVRDRYEINGEILSSGIIPWDELPFINALVLRFETHGDLHNETHLQNFINIAKKNPQTKFSLWTKQYDIAYEYFKVNKAPKNFTLIISSLMINHEMDITKYKALGVKTKGFTVYDKGYAEENKININCGAKDCKSCLRCYTGTSTHIRELLK